MSQVDEPRAAPRMTQDAYLYRLRAPASRRSFFRFCAVFGALVLLAIGLVVIRATEYSPAAAVREYFSALQGRDASVLWPIIDPDEAVSGPVRSTYAALLRDPGYTPPSNAGVRSTSAGDNDNQATATASYQIGSINRTAEFSLRRDSARLNRVFRPWHISNSTTQLGVDWSYPDAVFAAGEAATTTGGFGQASVEFNLFPGQYTIAIADNPLYTATATATVPTDQPVQLQPVMKPTVQPEVEKQVAALIARCATLLNGTGQGCPYSTDGYNSYSYETVTAVAWRVDNQPQFAVEIGSRGVVVTTTQPGLATPVITSVDSSNATHTEDGQQVSFRVDGTVAAPGGQVSYSYGGY